MIVELGNVAAHNGMDDRPKVTSIYIPDWDDGSTHPDAEYDGPHPHEPGETGKLVKAGPALGGYTHKVGGITVADFQKHRQEAFDFNNGITNLPDHEILLSIAAAWPTQSRSRPDWVHVEPERASKSVAKDISEFLAEYYSLGVVGKPADVEDTHWTRYGAPGQGPPLGPPPITNLLTNNGRVIANLNDGGGAVGQIGVGTAATAATLTTTSTLVTNALAGYRVVVYSTTANNMVWGNVLSNTNAAGASVITVDRWYNFATPGGSAATTPTTPWAWCVLDGGVLSAWFVGLATGANAVAATDTTLATNGNTEYATAGGGYIRKIAPYAQTSGVASRSLTLTPVYTGNGSDGYPQTFTTIGAFVGMVVGSTGTMKYETALNASATVAALGDQVTVTETVTGS